MAITFKGAACAFALVMSASAHAHSGHGAHAHDGHGAQQSKDAATAARPEGVSVSDCWIRAMPGRLPSAGYLTLHNAGAKDAVLVGAQAHGFDKVMLHTHRTTNGMATMVHVDDVTVPAGGSFEFEPGGHHIMLEKPSNELQVGGTQPITLWFEADKAITIECAVRPPGTLK